MGPSGTGKELSSAQVAILHYEQDADYTSPAICLGDTMNLVIATFKRGVGNEPPL